MNIKFFSNLLAVIAATPIDSKSCKGNSNPLDGKALGTLPEELQRFWSYINLKFLVISRLMDVHTAEHEKPDYEGERCVEVHAQADKLRQEYELLLQIFWEAVRGEVAGAREVNIIGIRSDFKVVEVKPDPRGSAEAALAELLGVGLR